MTEQFFFFVSFFTGINCPSGYTKSLDTSCYKFDESTVSRSNAQSECRVNSSHLVFIETKEENDFVMREAANGTEYWIGMHHGHDGPHLFWDNGKQVTFVNIDPDELGTFIDHTGCYTLHGNGERYWTEKGCSSTNGFICEYEG